MGKTSDLFKKTRDTTETFHAEMDTIIDGNVMDLTETQDIKKRWQEYTEELYKKIFMVQITMMMWSLNKSQTQQNEKSIGPQETSLRTKLVAISNPKR